MKSVSVNCARGGGGRGRGRGEGRETGVGLEGRCYSMTYWTGMCCLDSETISQY